MTLLWFWICLFGAQATQYFDFTIRPHQTGAYQVDPGIIIEEQSARLVNADNWRAPGWTARIRFAVRNETLLQLEEYPVHIDLSQLPNELFDIATIDGADLRLVDASGNAITHMWLENWDFIARTGDLWFQLPTLPPGSTTIELYFGNETDPPLGSWQQVFTYSSLKYGAWWPFPGTSQLSAAAFESARVQVGTAGVAVDLLPSPQTFSAEPGIISANGPYSMDGDLNASDAPVPFSMAGTAFTFPAQRGTDVILVFSPFGTAHVELRQAGNVLAQETVGQFTSISMNVDIPLGTYQLISDSPVLAYHYTSEGFDGHPLVFASTELWGAALGTVYVTALEDNTQLTVYRSDIAVTTHTLSRDTILTLSYGASAGSGPGLRLLADRPIGALSQADGTGGESVAFLPSMFLSREFILPRAASYVAVTLTQPSATCRARDTLGNLLTEITGGAVPPPYPNKILFGALPAGARITCTVPSAIWYEDSVLGDERHLLTVKDHRPFVWPQPLLESSLDDFDPLYFDGPATITTPLLTIPHRIRSWLGIDFMSPTDRPRGTSLRFQVSLDGGNTWQIFDGIQWKPATTGETMEPGYLTAGFPHLSPEPTLMLRAFLAGDGAQTPVLGPMALRYEYDEGAAQLRFAPIEGPVKQGVPFVVTVFAEDENGRILEGYNDSILLSAGSVRMLPTHHDGFVAGRADFYVVMLDAGENVQIMTTDGQVSGLTEPFDVIPSSAAALEKIAGDGQWGYIDEPLPIPLVVRLVSSDGSPLSTMPITFAASGGAFDGFDTPTAVVETNFEGYAAVKFIPALGMNSITVTHDNLPPVNFTVRGDDRNYVPQNAQGSTCHSAPGVRTLAPIFLPLFFMLLLWVRKQNS